MAIPASEYYVKIPTPSLEHSRLIACLQEAHDATTLSQVQSVDKKLSQLVKTWQTEKKEKYQKLNGYTEQLDIAILNAKKVTSQVTNPYKQKEYKDSIIASIVTVAVATLLICTVGAIFAIPMILGAAVSLVAFAVFSYDMYSNPIHEYSTSELKEAKEQIQIALDTIRLMKQIPTESLS